MLRSLEPEKGEKTQLEEREAVQDRVRQIVNTPRKLEKLKAIARSRTLGIWRIKRAKIILGTLAGKTVRKMVLEVRVPPESILKCQDLFSKQGFDYFMNPGRRPTQREMLVETILEFLEDPPPKRSRKWNGVSVRYIGHDFTARDIGKIRGFISEHPESTRAGIARHACKLFQLYLPNGKMKLTQTNDILKRMDMDNVITLPPPSNPRTSREKSHSPVNSFPEAGKEILLKTHDIRHLQFIPVYSKKDSTLWRELIEAFHYIKNPRLFGAQIRYLVYGDKALPGTAEIFNAHDFSTMGMSQAEYYNQVARGKHLLAVLGFSSSAWRLASRDSFIGWSDEQREKNLRLVVNNSRFLILPWIRSKYLASRILGGVAKQLPIDWERRYDYRPVLLETFVQQDRFKGTSYRAANWIKIGQTRGYSLFSSYKKAVATKTVLVYPLCKDFRKKLRDNFTV